MAEYDDGAYYEVQLNNKQLVFFFMAALAIAVVVFLCGVMVGRGVRDATLAVAQNDITAGPSSGANKPVPTAKAAPSTPELDYARRLESDDVPSRLGSQSPETVKSTSPETVTSARASASGNGGASTTRAAASDPTPRETASASTPARTAPPEPRPSSISTASVPLPAAGSARLGTDNGPFTIQVVALKTEDAAQSLLTRLKGKNYRAYLEGGTDAGLHRVRVGRFATRAEAERVAARLRDEEKFKPYITQ
jgi:cell division septation protein DedD